MATVQSNYESAKAEYTQIVSEAPAEWDDDYDTIRSAAYETLRTAENALIDFWRKSMIRDARRFRHLNHIGLIEQTYKAATDLSHESFRFATRDLVISQALTKRAR